MTTERYWIDHCIGIARDAGNLDAAQDATKELEALRSALTDAQEIARRGDDIILGLEKTLDAARSSLTARDEALREAEAFVDRHSEPWYTSGQELLVKIRAALGDK